MSSLSYILLQFRRCSRTILNLNGLETGFIRIGTISSIATHWLPNIIKVFQQDYPGVDYELLIGDYSQIESWIREGRMVEKGLGISILPDLILQRIPYNIVVKGLDEPAYRDIIIAFRSRETISLAVNQFLDYLQYRSADLYQ